MYNLPYQISRYIAADGNIRLIMLVPEAHYLWVKSFILYMVVVASKPHVKRPLSLRIIMFCETKIGPVNLSFKGIISKLQRLLQNRLNTVQSSEHISLVTDSLFNCSYCCQCTKVLMATDVNCLTSMERFFCLITRYFSVSKFSQLMYTNSWRTIRPWCLITSDLYILSDKMTHGYSHPKKHYMNERKSQIQNCLQNKNTYSHLLLIL